MSGFRLNLAPKEPFDLDTLDKIKLTPALIRLNRDLQEARSLLPNVTITYPVQEDNPYLVHISVSPTDGTKTLILASCKRIVEGMYEGGTFKFSALFKDTYPIDPPRVRCLQRILHPNVDLEGPVRLNILRLDWSPVLTLSSIIFGLLLLFDEPNPEDPLNKDAAELLKRSPGLFASRVRASKRGDTIDDITYVDVLNVHP